MMSPGFKRWLVFLLIAGAFVVVVANSSWWEVALRYLFPSETVVLHPGAPLLTLVWQHMQLVAISSGITVLVGVPLGVSVTRSWGREFLPIVGSITSLSQTFPPVAVLALAVPLFGFGALPTILALLLYGLLPVVRNTVAGLQSVNKDSLNAAYGIGMSPWQALMRVEIPLAMPVILAGIRISVVINVGTAMIGAVIGAGGIGSPIVAGLVRDNLAFIVEGALPAAMLALLADRLLVNVERSLESHAR
jgi:osmoprotectant transport system permease protein